MQWKNFSGIKHTNIHILEVPERVMRETENIFQNFKTGNTSNAMQNINLSIKKHNELKVEKCRDILLDT